MTEPAAPRPRGRLSWLDALRGLAALTVVYWHMRPLVPVPVPDEAWNYLELGKIGVVLFFLISGYIIPMSLERHGSLRRFWVSRIFRLYPAFLVATAAMVLLMTLGVAAFPNQLVQQTTNGVLAHATMLQGLLGVSNVVPVYWTLSYEMVFYFVVAGLFAFGLHLRSAWYATGLALVAVLAGPALPQSLLTGGGDRRTEAIIGVTVVFVAAVACFIARSRRLVVLGGILGLGMIAIVAVNGGESARASWQSLALLSIMFAGTTVHRMQHGQLRLLPGTAALVTVLIATTAGAWWHLDDRVDRQLWAIAIIVPALAFGAGFLLRHRQMPWILRKLGELSYSFYLLHLVLLPVVHHLVPDINDEPGPVRLAVFACLLAVLFGLSELVHRFVEMPAQSLGRRVARRLDARFGAAPRPVPGGPAEGQAPADGTAARGGTGSSQRAESVVIPSQRETEEQAAHTM